MLHSSLVLFNSRKNPSHYAYCLTQRWHLQVLVVVVVVINDGDDEGRQTSSLPAAYTGSPNESDRRHTRSGPVGVSTLQHGRRQNTMVARRAVHAASRRRIVIATTGQNTRPERRYVACNDDYTGTSVPSVYATRGKHFLRGLLFILFFKSKDSYKFKIIQYVFFELM